MEKVTNIDISEAYIEAEKFAAKHYENFPVVSFLLPKDLRKHVAIVYWFARTADDIADEGNLSSEERIKRLEIFEKSLVEAFNHTHESVYTTALVSTIRSKNLTSQLFFDLLKAFKQDVVKKRYSSFTELLNYCQYSANPVGRIILQLNEINDQQALKYSDYICTALQLTNFFQDTEIDFDKGRLYFPQDELEKFAVTEEDFKNKLNSENFKNLLKYNLDRTYILFEEGKKLLPYLKGRLKFEIKWTISGGVAILDKIKSNDYSVFSNRPKLSKFDFLKLLLKSFLL